MTRDVKFLRGDDWIGLYLDGLLRYEGHSIDYDQLMDFLKIPFEQRFEWDNDGFWERSGYRCPDTWDDVEAIALASSVED